MKDFSGTILFIKESDVKVNVKIEYKDRRLSIVGDLYENHNGYWRDAGGGQCYEELLEHFPESAPLVEIWMRWHLNDMNSGNEVQEAYLRCLASLGKKPTSGYENTCSVLEKAGLLEYEGYKYGHQWKFEEVPDHILWGLKEMIYAEGNK